MAVTSLTAFALPLQLDRGRIALGQPLTPEEVADIIERPHYAYGVGGRRELAKLPTIGAVETTSLTYVTVCELYVQLATTRDNVDVEIYGTNVTVQVEIEEADGTAIDSATLTRTTVGTATDSITGITPLPAVLVRVSMRVPTSGSGTASLEAVRVLESALVASDLP